MTWTITKLGLMLYLIIGIELAEWGFRQPGIRDHPDHIGPARGYLQMVFMGPLLLLLAVVRVLLVMISERLMWYRRLVRDDDIRIWTIMMIVLVLIVTIMPTPGLSER